MVPVPEGARIPVLGLDLGVQDARHLVVADDVLTVQRDVVLPGQVLHQGRRGLVLRLGVPAAVLDRVALVLDTDRVHVEGLVARVPRLVLVLDHLGDQAVGGADQVVRAGVRAGVLEDTQGALVAALGVVQQDGVDLVAGLGAARDAVVAPVVQTVAVLLERGGAEVAVQAGRAVGGRGGLGGVGGREVEVGAPVGLHRRVGRQREVLAVHGEAPLTGLDRLEHALREQLRALVVGCLAGAGHGRIPGAGVLRQRAGGVLLVLGEERGARPDALGGVAAHLLGRRVDQLGRLVQGVQARVARVDGLLAQAREGLLGVEVLLDGRVAAAVHVLELVLAPVGVAVTEVLGVDVREPHHVVGAGGARQPVVVLPARLPVRDRHQHALRDVELLRGPLELGLQPDVRGGGRLGAVRAEQVRRGQCQGAGRGGRGDHRGDTVDKQSLLLAVSAMIRAQVPPLVCARRVCEMSVIQTSKGREVTNPRPAARTGVPSHLSSRTKTA